MDSNGVQFRKDKKRQCRVVFSYTPVNDDELELEVDTVIDVLEEVEEGWWKGVLNGRVGVFPSNFVQDVESRTGSSNNDSRSSKESVTDGPDKGKTTGVSTSNQEIKPKPVRGVGLGNIFQDEMIKLKPAAPESAVEKKTPAAGPKKPPPPAVVNDAPSLPPKPVREQARVLFAYDACNEDELSLREGNIINILSKDVEDKGWWKGEINNKVGVFPDNFVELLNVHDSRIKKPERPSVSSSKSSAAAQKRVHPPEPGEKASDAPPPLPDHPKRSLPDVVRKDKFPDEKPERPDKPMPPLPSKKPQLPPPMKKPQRPAAPIPPASSAPAPAPAPAPTPVPSTTVTPPADGLTDDMKVRSQGTAKQPEETGNTEKPAFEGVEPTSDKLTHLTATRARNPHRRPPSHLFLKEPLPSLQMENGDVTDLSRVGASKGGPGKHAAPSAALLHHRDAKPDKDVLLEAEEKNNKPPPARPPAAAPAATTEPERPPPAHPVRREASDKSISRPPLPRISSAETDSSNKAKPHALPPKPAKDEGDARPVKSSSSSTEESLPLVIELRREIQQLKSQVGSLQQTMESHRLQYSEKVRDLTQEIDDEKKTRLLMQVELDRLKKLVKEH